MGLKGGYMCESARRLTRSEGETGERSHTNASRASGGSGVWSTGCGSVVGDGGGEKGGEVGSVVSSSSARIEKGLDLESKKNSFFWDEDSISGVFWITCSIWNL